MKQIVIFVVLFVSTLSSKAQTSEASLSQKIKGTVVDADSKKSLPGATITLVNSSTKTVANNEGNFSFSNVKVGRQTLKISSVGYKPCS